MSGSGFWREVPCGHPTDPVAALSLDDTPHMTCHCGWRLDVGEAISDGKAEGAPGPIVPCWKCGCYVAVPLGVPALVGRVARTALAASDALDGETLHAAPGRDGEDDDHERHDQQQPEQRVDREPASNSEQHDDQGDDEQDREHGSAVPRPRKEET